MKQVVYQYHMVKDKYGVIVRREDLRFDTPLPHHAKMDALEVVVIGAKENGYDLIGCFCTKHGIWPFGLPYFARKHGLKSAIGYPALSMGNVPAELWPIREETSSGYELLMLRPNVVKVNEAQVKNYLKDRNGFYIPFGVGMNYAVEVLANQIQFGPGGTLIVPCGSGVTLAGVIKGGAANQFAEIIAVSAGRPIEVIKKAVEQYAIIPNNVRFIQEHEYNQIPKIICPWEAHPYYELKAFDWLYRNVEQLTGPITFLNIGSK